MTQHQRRRREQYYSFSRYQFLKKVTQLLVKVKGRNK